MPVYSIAMVTRNINGSEGMAGICFISLLSDRMAAHFIELCVHELIKEYENTGPYWWYLV